MTRRTGVALLVALAAALLAPSVAAAHATLEATAPGRGERLARSPEQITLRFDESVHLTPGALKVFDARGREVQQGAAFHPGGEGARTAVRLAPRLPAGGYTATYRVVSADSHPVSGGFTFTVGSGAAGSASVADLLRGQTSGPVTSTALSVVRAVQYAALAAGLGTFIFLLACWRPGLRAAAAPGPPWDAAVAAFGHRARALLGTAAWAGLLSALLALGLEGAQSEGTSLWSALHRGVIGDVLTTRFGLAWAGAALAWVVVGAWALSARGPTAPVVLAAPLGALALVPALTGHSSVEPPVALLLPANIVHVVAMAAWLGGIAVLVLALRVATRRLESRERTSLLVAVVSRFSTLAGVAVAALLVTGLVQAVVEVASLDALTSTAFGRAVALKLMLLSALVTLGSINRARILPALRGAADSPLRAGVLLRRTLRAELAVGVAALAVTGALAGYPPAKAAARGPVVKEADVGPAHLQLTVAPARTGANELHLYLFDRRTGAQFAAAKEVRIAGSLPSAGIDQLPLDVHTAGPGHATGSASLAPAGDWRLTRSRSRPTTVR